MSRQFVHPTGTHKRITPRLHVSDVSHARAEPRAQCSRYFVQYVQFHKNKVISRAEGPRQTGVRRNEIYAPRKPKYSERFAFVVSRLFPADGFSPPGALFTRMVRPDSHARIDRPDPSVNGPFRPKTMSKTAKPRHRCRSSAIRHPAVRAC